MLSPWECPHRTQHTEGRSAAASTAQNSSPCIRTLRLQPLSAELRGSPAGCNHLTKALNTEKLREKSTRQQKEREVYCPPSNGICGKSANKYLPLFVTRTQKPHKHRAPITSAPSFLQAQCSQWLPFLAPRRRTALKFPPAHSS